MSFLADSVRVYPGMLSDAKISNVAEQKDASHLVWLTSTVSEPLRSVMYVSDDPYSGQSVGYKYII